MFLHCLGSGKVPLALPFLRMKEMDIIGQHFPYLEWEIILPLFERLQGKMTFPSVQRDVIFLEINTFNNNRERILDSIVFMM